MTCETRQTAYVTTNGVHLYLILPAARLEPGLRDELTTYVDARYLSFGWGDREFYRTTPTWDDLRAGTALRALFWPTLAAMHVVGYQQAGSGWRPVELCPSQLRQLNDFLGQSFQRDENGDLLPVATDHYSARDHFFGATGRYTCFRTSNVWVNQALKKAQVSTAVWSPFDWGVWRHLE